MSLLGLFCQLETVDISMCRITTTFHLKRTVICLLRTYILPPLAHWPDATRNSRRARDITTLVARRGKSHSLQALQYSLNWNCLHKIWSTGTNTRNGIHRLRNINKQLHLCDIIWKLMDLLPLTSHMNFGGATLKMA